MARRMISAKSGREQHFDDIVARLGFEPWWMPHYVPGAGHVDLYDRVNLIPWDKLESFFNRHLAV